jgi:hypothetical protein
MLPRGGNNASSDADVCRAVDFMLAAAEALRTETASTLRSNSGVEDN